MKFYQKIWKDIQAGENIDLYVTILISIVLVSFNLLGFVPTSSLTSINLAVLALVTITILGNRHRIETIKDSVNELINRESFLQEYPTSLLTDLEESQNIWLTGTHHSSTLTVHYPLFERSLKKGGKLKALLVSPDGDAFKMTSMRFATKVSPEHERMRIIASLESLGELQKIAPERVEIRVIDFLLDYSSFLLNPESPNATIYLERYTFRTSGGSRKPKFVYRRKDGSWFDHVQTEIKNLWEAGTPYKPTLMNE